VVEVVGRVVIIGGGVGGGAASYILVHPAIQNRIPHDERGAQAAFVTQKLEPNPDAILISISRDVIVVVLMVIGASRRASTSTKTGWHGELRTKCACTTSQNRYGKIWVWWPARPTTGGRSNKYYPATSQQREGPWYGPHRPLQYWH
jgi:hypothetical protein